MSPKIISEADFTDREIKIIEIARSLIEKECITTLTIDKLVAATPYSKGTIYKHFISKEDLFLAICNTCMSEIKTLFLRALQFKGGSRDKLEAIMVSYLIWAKLHPAQLFAVLTAHSPSVTACSSEARLIEHQKCEYQLMELIGSEITLAIKNEDFCLPSHMTLEQITFSYWSAAWGAMALIMSKGNSKKLEPMLLERESFTNTRLILDGFGWTPLSSDRDYNQVVRKITHEIFPPEIEALIKMRTPFVFS